MGSRKNVWTLQEEQLMFSSHASMGSKWAAIANLIVGKDQNAIKNKFYSTLRRGHRKINSYITEIKRKSDPLRNRVCKTIHEIFISKLIAVVDRSYEEKYEVKPAALTLATDIERLLIEVACSEGEGYHWQEGNELNFAREEQLLQKILEFNKNCKKRKGKRNVNDKRRKKSEDIEQSQIITESKVAEVKLQQKSQQLGAINQQPTQIKVSSPKADFSFLTMVRKESSSTVVNSVSSFASMARYFKEYCESRQVVQEFSLNQSAGSVTNSSCPKEEKSTWMFESGSSQFSLHKRQPDYLTGPSPNPNDPFSPFTLSNLMKNKNITANNMFEDKISCNESDLHNSSINQRDGLPIITKPRNGEFLIKSADLLREINQEAPALTSSMKIEKEAFPTYSSIISEIDERHFVNSRSFVSQYVFQLHNPPSNNSPKQ